MNVYEEKENFVDHELLKLCQRISPDVLNLRYERNKNGEESVTIYWLLPDKSTHKKIVNVTADSLRSLAHDVIMYV